MVGVIACDPLMAEALNPAPEMVQLVAFVDDQVNFVELPRVRDTGDAEIFTTGASTGTGTEGVTTSVTGTLIVLPPAFIATDAV